MSSFKLEFENEGQQQDFTFEGGQVTIGREKESDFVLDHPTVSRQHALIVSDGAGHRLVVLSRSGLTAIDGEQVQGDVRLYDGSQINFGTLQCVYRSDSAPPRPQQAGAGAPGYSEAPTEMVSLDAVHQATASEPTEQVSMQAAQSSGSSQAGQPGQSPQATSSPSNTPAGFSSPGAAAGWTPPGGGSGESQSAQQPSTAGEGGGWESPETPEEGGIVSWDQIAAEAATAEEIAEAQKTDYEKMQEAQEKAEKASKGTSPVLIVGVVLAVAFLAFAYLKPPKPKGAGGGDPTKEIPTGEITMKVDCVGEAGCKAKAINAFRVGKSAYDKMGADVTNLYESHMQFTRAGLLLEKGNISSLPAEMAEMPDLKEEVSEQLKALFQRHRLNIIEHQKRKDYEKMANELTRFQGYIPDDRCDYNQWASKMENKMKEEGVYPVSPVY